ncbi:alpha-amylase family glycosyl hydrolase [Streptomyces purpurascens]
MVDLVPNHSSTSTSGSSGPSPEGPGSPLRERYRFRRQGGERRAAPNDWESIFGGPAWTRGPGEWYLHLFAPEQPDFDWEHPAVGDEFAPILRFWLDMGVDGFRIDVTTVW